MQYQGLRRGEAEGEPLGVSTVLISWQDLVASNKQRDEMTEPSSLFAQESP